MDSGSRYRVTFRGPPPIPLATLWTVLEDRLRPDRVRRCAPLPPPWEELGVKAFRGRAFPASLRRFLLPTPACREWRIANRLADRGLPVPTPVALLEPRDPGGTAFYVFRWMRPFVDLQEAVLREALSARERRVIGRTLGHRVRAMHEAGIVHRDLHAGNLLVEHPGPRDPATGPRVLLSDFHRARMPGLAVARRRRRDLLDLSHFFRGRARPTEMLRFLRAYGLATGSEERAARHRRLRRLGQAAQDSWLAFARRHERRYRGRGRNFRSFRFPGGHGIAAREVSAPLRARLVELLESAVQEPDPEPADRVAVHRLDGNHEDLRALIFTERPAAWPRVPGRLSARGGRVWMGLHRLAMSGLPAAGPLCCAEHAGVRRRRRSCVLVRWPGRAVSLDAGLPELPAAELESLLEGLGRRLAELHRAGLRCPRASLRAFAWDRERRTLTWVLADGAVREVPVRPRHAAADLDALLASLPAAAEQAAATVRAAYLRRG